MKKMLMILFFTFLIFNFYPAIIIAQNEFEGEIEMVIKAEENAEILLKVKGKYAKMVSESEEGTVEIIFDSQAKKMVTVLHEQQMYMEFLFDEMEEFEGESDEKSDVDIKKTGNKKTINGYECFEYIVSDAGQVVEMWVADTDIPFLFFQDFGMWGEQSNSKSLGKYKDLMKGFPMLITIKDMSGNIESQVEVTSLKKIPLAKEEFEIPQNYQKINMPMMNMDKNR